MGLVVRPLVAATRARADLCEMTVRVGREPPDVHEHVIAAGSAWDRARLEDVPLAHDAWIALVLRDGAVLQPADGV
jgi:hypothetical protein